MRQPLAVPRTLRRSALFVVTVVLAPAAVPVVTADTIQCATGWNQEMKDIPQDWINDGYCDCPLDGADEPNTDACSGSRAWPGIQLTVRGSSEEERYVKILDTLQRIHVKRHYSVCSDLFIFL